MFADFIDWRFEIGPLGGIVILTALVAIVFLIWMLIDAINRPVEHFSSPGAKTAWIVGLIGGIVFGFGFLGFVVAIAYLFAVKIPAGSKAPAPAWTAPPSPGAAPVPPPPPGPAIPPLPTNCRTCGVKLVAGARFCHSCGTPVA
jgi:hypothetical protein